MKVICLKCGKEITLIAFGYGFIGVCGNCGKIVNEDRGE